MLQSMYAFSVSKRYRRDTVFVSFLNKMLESMFAFSLSKPKWYRRDTVSVSFLDKMLESMFAFLVSKGYRKDSSFCIYMILIDIVFSIHYASFYQPTFAMDTKTE